MFITLFFGTFLAEDLTCVAAGLAVARGALTLPAAIAACAAGIWVGDLGLWLVGRVCGARVLSWRRVKEHLAPDVGPRFREWFHAHAPRVILASRLAPGTRLPLAIFVVAHNAAWFAYLRISRRVEATYGLESQSRNE